MINTIFSKHTSLAFYIVICIQANNIFCSQTDIVDQTQDVANIINKQAQPTTAFILPPINQTFPKELGFFPDYCTINSIDNFYEEGKFRRLIAMELPYGFVNRLIDETIRAKCSEQELKMENTSLLKVNNTLRNQQAIIAERPIFTEKPQTFSWSSFALGATTTAAVSLSIIAIIQNKDFLQTTLK